MKLNLGELIQKLLISRDIKQVDLFRIIKQRDPETTIDRSRINRYINGGIGLSRDVCRYILKTGFGMSDLEAEEEIAKFVIESEKENMSSETLKDILSEDKGSVHLMNVDLEKANLVPVYSSVGAGFVSDSEVEILYFYPLPPSIKYERDQLFWAVVHGNSMASTISDKDWVLVRKGVGNLINGNPYVFWYDGEHTIKNYHKKSEPGVYELVPENPEHQSILVTKERSDSIYPVGEVLQVLKKVIS
jgi:SOS-response transcriptional repressors (RecA-mediated autopeptidases)